MFKYITKIKRSGDQRIGKMIVFSEVIIIAIWLIGLVWYFYTDSRKTAITKAILASTSSNGNDINKIAGLENCLSNTTLTYDVISDIYTLQNNGNALCNFWAFQSKGIEILSPTTYKIK